MTQINERPATVPAPATSRTGEKAAAGAAAGNGDAIGPQAPGGVPPNATGRPRTVHLIGFAHIDPVWLWCWPEGMQEVRATFWSAIERMREYPDFVFTCNQVATLDWVERTDPALFEQIRQRVSEGRWQNVGGWWVEPDCNLPHGESLVRQGLYGQRYLRRAFGRMASVGLSADSFGHGGALPQILSKQRLRFYGFSRPGRQELGLPADLFWWEADEGSRVLAYRIPATYLSPAGALDRHVAETMGALVEDAPIAAVFYGVGNHGGGPTRANLDSLASLSQAGGDIDYRLSGLSDFFESVAGSDLDPPVWRSDLQHHAVGCYSAMARVKALMRGTEHALLRAERWATVAAHLRLVEYPRHDLERAWKALLFNQFHDILPGSAIEEAYDSARDELGLARAVARQAETVALQAIARSVDIPRRDGCQPVLVFNPHLRDVTAEVGCEFGGMRGFEAPLWIEDADGRPVAFQVTQASSVLPRRVRVVFTASVPALGYRLYWLVPASFGAGMDALVVGADPDLTLENDTLRLRFDAETGNPISLLHKPSGVDLLAPGSGRWTQVTDDRSDTWSHGVSTYGTDGESFVLRSVAVVERGPVRTVVRVCSDHGSSTLTQDYVLGANDPFVRVRVVLDWHERLKIFKLRFPTALSRATAVYETPYGRIARTADGREEPGQSWVAVTGTLPGGARAGLAVANNAKGAYDVTGGSIGITAARSPVYAWHQPSTLDPGIEYRYQDQGEQRFEYLMLPFPGARVPQALAHHSAVLNQPLLATFESFHTGRLSRCTSFGRATSPGVMVTVVKAAEDDPDEVIIRAVESAGEGGVCAIELPFLQTAFTATFDPYEIKTFRVSSGAVQEVDLLELLPDGADANLVDDTTRDQT